MAAAAAAVGWGTYLYYAFVAALVIYALISMPKIEPPKAAALKDFDIPTASEGRPITVVLGTREISGPNVVWYGDLKIEAIRERVK